MKIQLRQCYLFILILSSFNSFSQDTLVLIANPSFEEEPRKGSYYDNTLSAKRNKIKGWYDCGVLKFPNETAPDIHGGNSKLWSNQHQPSEGNSYIGLVVRDNFTWESVSQELDKYLKSGFCYRFTIDISMSNSYLSGSRLYKDDKPTYSYNNPSVLSIWAGDGYCERKELLFETIPIDHEDWRTYEIIFQPITNMKHITFEAYYIDEDNPQNGNILLDNISPIVMTRCDK